MQAELAEGIGVALDDTPLASREGAPRVGDGAAGMSRLREVAKTAAREAHGEPREAIDRFMAGIEAEVEGGTDVNELFSEIHGVMKDAPIIVAGAAEALGLAGGDASKAEVILGEKLDTRENPEFTGSAKAEMRKILIPALLKILREELEAYRREQK
jgi:hypothetical protein